MTHSPSALLTAKLQRARTHYQLGQLTQAETSYEDVLRVAPRHFETLVRLGLLAARGRRPARALQYFEMALNVDAGSTVALHNKSLALQELGRWEAALACYDEVMAIKPERAETHRNRGHILRHLRRFDAALASYDRAIAIKPALADAFLDRCTVLAELGQPREALASCDKAISIRPDFADAYFNRGNLLTDLKQMEEALESYDRALAIKSDFAEAHCNRGNVLRDLKLFALALASYDRAIAIKGDYVEAHCNRGNVLRDLMQIDAAISSYDRAIDLNGDYAAAYACRGDLYFDQAQYPAAIASYDRALRLEPNLMYAGGRRQHARAQLCAWGDYESGIGALAAGVESGRPVTPPGGTIVWSDSLRLQRLAAEIFVRTETPPNPALPEIAKTGECEKIRVGYFSADFHNHPVSSLAVEMFEAHDRSRFEVTAFSFGPDTGDALRSRLKQAFDRFIDVRSRSDREVALTARGIGLDIAIDLNGLTARCRPNIFALRAAPLQVGYLGYAGTTGASYMDYLVADPIIVPPVSRQHYAEKILYIPSYQVNPSSRPVAATRLTRRELGLPADGFVFCCFNTNYKITPAMFSIWMRLLHSVAGSVLWLRCDDPTTIQNLAREAAVRAISPERLIFAPKLASMELHLARYREADLFLDTFPYGAHTTASDALWAGLPVVTLAGESFASRVGASVLTVMGTPELITTTPEHYEKLAAELALDPERLAAIRQRIVENRQGTPLFDTRLFTRNIEAAYTRINDRHRAGLPPEHTDWAP